MAEYKNGVTPFGNKPVYTPDRSAEVQTGRAVYHRLDKETESDEFKAKMDQCEHEGFHEEEAPVTPESSDPSMPTK